MGRDQRVSAIGALKVPILRSSSYHVSELDCKFCDLALKVGTQRDGDFVDVILL